MREWRRTQEKLDVAPSAVNSLLEGTTTAASMARVLRDEEALRLGVAKAGDGMVGLTVEVARGERRLAQIGPSSIAGLNG